MESNFEHNKGSHEITDDEANFYDRQIRLWGVRSQKLIRAANVLCIGLSGLASEAIKNIVLSGINSLTVIDHLLVTEYDSINNIFTRNKLGVNRAKAAETAIKTLNPMVDITVLEWNVSQKLNEDKESLVKLFKTMDVVLVTNQSKDLMISINELCRSISDKVIKFYAACDWGFYGFSFGDLGKKYKYITEEVLQKVIDFKNETKAKKPKIEEKVKSHVEKIIDFVPLSLALSVRSGKSGVGLTKRTSPVFLLTHVMLKFYTKFGRYPDPKNRINDIEELKILAKTVVEELDVGDTLLEKLESEDSWENVFGEISPVCAVIGGVVGQDIIRSITGQDPPIKNFFLFNGLNFTGVVESIGK